MLSDGRWGEFIENPHEYDLEWRRKRGLVIDEEAIERERLRVRAGRADVVEWRKDWRRRYDERPEVREKRLKKKREQDKEYYNRPENVRRRKEEKLVRLTKKLEELTASIEQMEEGLKCEQSIQERAKA